MMFCQYSIESIFFLSPFRHYFLPTSFKLSALEEDIEDNNFEALFSVVG